jgi:hypothetical protein
MLGQPMIGAGFAVVGIIVLARPLALLPAMIVAAGAATLVNYEGGHLTRDLGILSLLLGYVLACWWAALSTGRWGLPRSRLTLALAFFAATTAWAGLRGLLVGHSPKALGLDLFPALAVLSAVLPGGLRISEGDLRKILAAFIVISVVHWGLGFYIISVVGTRAGSIYFTPVPALVALLLFNLALREERPGVRAVQLLGVGLLMLHQLLSFTRGFWLAALLSFPVSCLVYAGRGPGSMARWRRVGVFTVVLIAVGALGALVLGALFGWGPDAFAIVGARFASSLGTEAKAETASNVARLVEYSTAWRQIVAAPWFGHGLGHEILIKQVILGRRDLQWYLHEAYLWIWLKQGIVGLAALLGALAAAAVMSIRAARRVTGVGAAWCGASAACTVHLAAVSVTQLGFAQVSMTFLLAILWGIALSVAGTPRYVFVPTRRDPRPGREKPVGDSNEEPAWH